MFYKELLEEIMSSKSESLLKFMKSISPLVRNLCAKGVNEEVVRAALIRLRDLEALRPGGGKRQNLEDTLEGVESTKRALIRTFRQDENPHRETIRALETSAERIRQTLEPWNEKRGRRVFLFL